MHGDDAKLAAYVVAIINELVAIINELVCIWNGKR